EERFQLSARSIPVNRRRGDKTLGWQIGLKKGRTEAIVDRTLPARLPALAAVAQEGSKNIVSIDQAASVPGLGETFAGSPGEPRRISAPPWTGAQDEDFHRRSASRCWAISDRGACRGGEGGERSA